MKFVSENAQLVPGGNRLGWLTPRRIISRAGHSRNGFWRKAFRTWVGHIVGVTARWSRRAFRGLTCFACGSQGSHFETGSSRLGLSSDIDEAQQQGRGDPLGHVADAVMVVDGRGDAGEPPTPTRRPRAASRPSRARISTLAACTPCGAALRGKRNARHAGPPCPRRPRAWRRTAPEGQVAASVVVVVAVDPLDDDPPARGATRGNGRQGDRQHEPGGQPSQRAPRSVEWVATMLRHPKPGRGGGCAWRDSNPRPGA